METAILVYIGIINRVETRHVWDSRSMAQGLSVKLNPKPLNPKPLNPKPLDPKPLTHKP